MEAVAGGLECTDASLLSIFGSTTQILFDGILKNCMPRTSLDLLQPSGLFHHLCGLPHSDFVSMGMLIKDTGLASVCSGYSLQFQILLNSTL